jgi:uncharacterized SAM-binding protein YcdF (DUF218 family)
LLVSEPSEFLLPIPVYLVAILTALCVVAFRRRSSRLGRARYALVVAVLWSYGCSTPALANILTRRVEDRFPSADAAVPIAGSLILTLSSGWTCKRGDRWETGLDRAGWERAVAATRLWRRMGGELLFVGGQEAQLMADFAVASGVPAEVIHVETRSRNTYENILFSRDLLSQRSGRTWLVTSALHMPRAMAVAAKLGISLRPAPCDRRAFDQQHWYVWLPNAGGPGMFSAVLHEQVGLAVYRLKGYAV